jgi:hypothetical protein
MKEAGIIRKYTERIYEVLTSDHAEGPRHLHLRHFYDGKKYVVQMYFLSNEGIFVVLTKKSTYYYISSAYRATDKKRLEDWDFWKMFQEDPTIRQYYYKVWANKEIMELIDKGEIVLNKWCTKKNWEPTK